MSDGGSGSGINSVIEAEFRARELGGQPSPDAAEQQRERMVQRAGWVVAGLVVTGGAWLVAGPGAAVIVFAAIALGGLAAWWVIARLRNRGRGTAPRAPG